MTGNPSSPDSGRSPAVRIDQLCDEFEARLRAGESPRIEDYLLKVSESDRAPLLGELVPLEVEYRRRRDEHPTLAEFEQRFPGDQFSWPEKAVDSPAAGLHAKPGSNEPTSDSNAPRVRGNAAPIIRYFGD